MELTVTVVIPDSMIQACATAAATGLFKPGEWGNKGGVGYQLVASQVEEAVKSLDVTGVAKETAARFAKGIVEDVTKSAIKRLAQNAVKEMKEAGELGI